MPLNKIPSRQRDEQLDALAHWHSTPSAKREFASVSALAEAKGWVSDRRFQDMAESPEVFHRQMLKIAGGSLDKAPAILEALYHKAIEGHVKAAEVYLEWSRKLITDAKVIERVAPAVNPVEVLHAAIEGAHKLMQVAAAVPSEEAAKTVIDEVEADFYEP